MFEIICELGMEQQSHKLSGRAPDGCFAADRFGFSTEIQIDSFSSHAHDN